MDHRRVAHVVEQFERDRSKRLRVFWRITSDNVTSNGLAVRRMERGVEVFPLSDGSDGPRTVQESRSLLVERRSSVAYESDTETVDSEMDEDATVELPDTVEEAENEIGGLCANLRATLLKSQ